MARYKQANPGDTKGEGKKTMSRWNALPEELDPQIREFEPTARARRPERADPRRLGRPHGVRHGVLGAVPRRAATSPARGRRGARRGDGRPAAPPRVRVGAGRAGLEPGGDGPRQGDGHPSHQADTGCARTPRRGGPRRVRGKPARRPRHRAPRHRAPRARRAPPARRRDRGPPTTAGRAPHLARAAPGRAPHLARAGAGRPLGPPLAGAPRPLGPPLAGAPRPLDPPLAAAPCPRRLPLAAAGRPPPRPPGHGRRPPRRPPTRSHARRRSGRRP